MYQCVKSKTEKSIIMATQDLEEQTLLPTNPNEIRNMLGNTLQIELVNNKVLKGNLVSLDPQSNTLILVDEASDNKHVHVINYYKIKTVSILSTERMYIQLYKCSSQDIEDKERLIKWYKSNGIDLIEEENVLKCNSFYIEPPYDIDHCYCSNSVTLDKMKDILKTFPTQLVL